ncbi:unnamed protein product [Didymodactylos carnosus]|uniref:Uncharacterized protein n=1 Tax=Didymodactylos carnosus TaxID=1234261 RepID=A0A813VLT1_9BILA|nr:unnamed protein product [Didymodactylos carnosus]CAF0839408.1 unnamed protein product [Didymodactylos carnosus]CAF3538502.1 unnamed protein product [Didymodactylos carnosus]CAF3626690.1 unnamed protein product [Didymodactylos carnosus]
MSYGQINNGTNIEHLLQKQNLDLEYLTLFHLFRNISSQLYFSSFPNLYSLNLTSNHLTEISFNLTTLPNLHILILSQNNLTQITSKTFHVLSRLEYLELNHNEIRRIEPYSFSNLSNLKYIDLRYNKLTNLYPPEIKQFSQQNKVLLINNNPLKCQCINDKQFKFICEKVTTSRNILYDDKKCQTPYFDKTVHQLLPIPTTLTQLRFSKFILQCPIQGEPLPTIIWSTPFGQLTTSSSIDQLYYYRNTTSDLYTSIMALAGPLTARTKHHLRAYNHRYLEITRARSALNSHIECTGYNLLGSYTYKFSLNVNTHIQDRLFWQLIYTVSCGLFISLVAGALCISMKRTYYSKDNIKTPPIYPTMAPNSASRTPPNFAMNEWLSLAYGNISDTLEQVRDKLRASVQQVSVHMGTTMARGMELFTHGLEHAGGTLRQTAETSAAYLQSFRETSQQRLNTIRVTTLTSLRHPGNMLATRMRAGMNILYSNFNPLREFCGTTTGIGVGHASVGQQMDQKLTTIDEEGQEMGIDDNIPESGVIQTSALIHHHRSPHLQYTGTQLQLPVLHNAGIGQLSTATATALLMNNFDDGDTLENESEVSHSTPLLKWNGGGNLAAGIGTFQHDGDELVYIEDKERFTMYGQKRPPDDIK